MSISVLFEKTIVTNNYSGVIIARSKMTNSIFGQKMGQNLSKSAGFC
jgi:hypothetical protein